MRCRSDRRSPLERPGKILVLTVLLLPVILGAAALAVDLGLQCAVQAKLRTVSDAAALSGARALALAYISSPTGYTTQNLTAATTAAQSIASQPGNTVLGTTLTFAVGNGGSGTGTDMLVGYLDITNTNSVLDTSAGSAAMYNSVQVTAMRAASRNNPVPSAFAAIWGLTGMDVIARSTATAQLYSIQGFNPGGSAFVNLLPIVMPQANYSAMIGGSTPDQYSYDPATNTVSSGSDGLGESQLYPIGSGDPGNWGTVKIGVSNNSTSVLGNQIQYGITAEQMATYPNSTLQLDPSLNPPSLTLGGNPGLSAGIKGNLAAIIGEARPIAIYDESGGNGNNAWYQVVDFAFVRVMASNFKGGNKYVVVQPAVGFDSTAIPGPPIVGGTWQYGGLVRLSLTR